MSTQATPPKPQCKGWLPGVCGVLFLIGLSAAWNATNSSSSPNPSTYNLPNAPVEQRPAGPGRFDNEPPLREPWETGSSTLSEEDKLLVDYQAVPTWTEQDRKDAEP